MAVFSYKRIALLSLELLVVFLALWLPRRAALGRFVTPDELLWLERSQNFAVALAEGDLQATYQKEHPGVTVMWAGAAGVMQSYQSYCASVGCRNKALTMKDYLMKATAWQPLYTLVSGRAIMGILTVLALMMAYWFWRDIVGRTAAMICFLLVAFEPFHIALTRLLHLDGLLSSLYLLALVAFLRYLHGGNAFHWITSAAATGLAMLTKSPGILIIPSVAIIALFERQLRGQGLRLTLSSLPSSPTKLSGNKTLRDWLAPYIAWLIVACLVFVVLWPAMWFAPLRTLSNVFSMAEQHVIGGHDTAVFFNGHIFPDGNIGWRFFYFYPLTYLWRTTPIVLVGLLAAAWELARRKKINNIGDSRVWVYILSLSALIFTIGMTLGGKKFDRYLLPVYPMMDIVAGLGYVSLWQHGMQISQAKGEKSHSATPGRQPRELAAILPGVFLWGALGMVILIQAGSALNTFPYYLSYYNPLLGGAQRAPQVMMIGWGEGLDQAARYLNQKSQARQLQVMSWYAWGPFSYFFEGRPRNLNGHNFNQDDWKTLQESDYLVVYIHQWQRDIPADVLDYLSDKTPEHSIWLNGIEYARIYPLH